MPYRRLPNTDKARLRAMRIAYQKAEDDGSVIPFELLYKLRVILPEFEQAIDMYNGAFTRQVEASKKVKQDFRMARLYVSHFLQVLNMAIQRKEIKIGDRKFFGLSISDLSIPKIQTEKDLIKWGRKIIEGEEKRLASGRSPITNPRISVVNIYFERFMDSYRYYKKLQEITQENLREIARQRPIVDKLIQNLWNTIEKSFQDLPADLKREKSSEYGVVYFLRKEEKESI